MPEVTESQFPIYRRRTSAQWNTWLDGQVWSFHAGIDYWTSAHSFRRLIKQVAANRGIDVTVRVQGDEVRVQAHR